MASAPPELDAVDALDGRREGGLAWGVSELAYSQMQSVAVDHALLPRTAAMPVPRPWTCAGPRNIGGRITALAQDPTNALKLWAGSGHGGLWRTTDAGDTWDHVGGQAFNDPVGALAIHPAKPNSIWVGTGSHRADSVSGTGLYRVTVAPDGTIPAPRRLAPAPAAFDPPASMTAQPATRGAALRYTAIELDPENADCAFVAGQTGLWHCVDTGGAPAWRRLLPAESAALASADSDPNGLPPLRSTPLGDLNRNWAPYVTDLRVARDPREHEMIELSGGREVARYLVVFAAVSAEGGGVGGIYRGRFDRATNRIRWDSQAANIPFPLGLIGQYQRARLALCRSQPSHVYAVFEGVSPPSDSPAGPVYRSTDCGDRWTPGGVFAGDNNQAFYSMVLEVHPDDPSIVVGGTLDLAISTDGGATFSQILDWQFYDRGDHAQHADQHALVFDVGDRRKLWSGNDGGLAMARDISGRVARPGFWRKRSHGIIAGQFQDLSVFPAAADGQLRYLTTGGLQDNGSWISYGGPTWYHIGWADGAGSAIHAGDPRAVFSAQNGWCNYTTIASGLPAGNDRVIAAPVLADIAAVQPVMEVAHSWFQLAAGALAGEVGPFVGFVDQDPRPANAGQVLYSWTVYTTPPPPGPPPLLVIPTPLAYTFNVPALTAPALPFLQMAAAFATPITPPAPPVLVDSEETSAIAYGPPPAGPPGQVDGWIGTSRGRLFHTADAPLGAAAPWAALAGFPPAPLQPHQPDRILPHPVAANLVALAASPVGGTAATPRAIQPIVVSLSSPPGAVGVASVTFASGTVVSAPAVTAPIMELGDSGLVVRFTAGALAAGDSWTIGTDNSIVRNGATVNGLEVIARLYGRVLLSYDRGVTWTDMSWARARPAAPARSDSDSLPFCPVTSLRWDLGPGAAGPLSLYVGTLAGVYVLENVPGPATAPPALAGFNPVWRPFAGIAPGLLPLTLVNDIEMIGGSRTLRIGTFGRGVWDCDLDGGPRRRLFIRQTVVENGRQYPRAMPALLPDDPRVPAGRLFMDHAHAFDIRLDTAPFEFLDDIADGVEFDERIGVDDIRPLERQAVYVQVHNSGWDVVHDVSVHLLWTTGPAAPLAINGPPPPRVPPGLPDAATFYITPDFDPPAVWQRVGAARLVPRVRPGEPKVVRFDWTPPETLDLINTNVALLALCTSVEDPLPAALPGGVVTMADFLAAERRAALRIVPVRTASAVDLFIRDGVDDDARLGNVAFVGRSPDIIVAQAESADPAASFAQLLDARPGDILKGAGANHIYVRVHNRGLTNAIAEVRVWATPIDTNQQPAFAIASWIPLTAAPPATGEIAVVRANSTELVPVVWTDPPDPNPADAGKAYGLIVTLGGVGAADPPPDVPTLTSAAEFWAYFGERFASDNAALRVLRWEA